MIAHGKYATLKPSKSNGTRDAFFNSQERRGAFTSLASNCMVSSAYPYALIQAVGLTVLVRSTHSRTENVMAEECIGDAFNAPKTGA